MKKITISKLSIILTFLLLINSSAYSQWQKTNGIKGGYFYQVAGNESNLLAVTNYGTVFHYNNGEWNFKSSFNYMNDIYKLQDKWVAYNYNNILRSEDNGATWQDILHPDESNFLIAAKVIDYKIYGLASDTLYHSTDLGETWNMNEVTMNIVSGSDTGIFYAISTFYVKDNIMIAGGFSTLPTNFSSLAFSTDLGQTWQATNFPNSTFSNFIHDITGDENFYYASGSDGFFKSANGIDWLEINDGLPFEGISVSVSKMDIFEGDLIAIINNTPAGLYRFNGTTWNLFFDDDFPVYLSTENDELIFTAGGEVIKYNENNNVILTSDLIASSSRPVVSSGGNVYSVFKSKLYRSIDKGLNWDVIKDSSSANIVIDENNIFMPSVFGVVRSTNSGTDWTTLTSGIPSSHIPKLSSVGLANGKLYAGFSGTRPRMHLPAVWEQGGVYVSENNGDSWSPLNSGLPTEGGVHSPVYSITAEANIVIIYTVSGRFSLINNNWVNITNGFPVNTYISSIFLYKDDVIFITNNGLFISHDKGVTKEPFDNGLQTLQNYLTILFSYKAELYIFSNDELMTVYRHDGSQWVVVDFPMPENLRFTSFQAVGEIIYAGTYDNGIWKYDPTFTDNDEVINPLEYNLSQNYPNPFNPVTTINYQLAAGGNVQVKIFDVLGKEVATLINENKPAGEYQITFDASSLTSGVYFYRIITTNFSETRKMILLR